jgi:hypothetical protein
MAASPCPRLPRHAPSAARELEKCVGNTLRDRSLPRPPAHPTETRPPLSNALSTRFPGPAESPLRTAPRGPSFKLKLVEWLSGEALAGWGDFLHPLTLCDVVPAKHTSDRCGEICFLQNMAGYESRIAPHTSLPPTPRRPPPSPTRPDYATEAVPAALLPAGCVSGGGVVGGVGDGGWGAVGECGARGGRGERRAGAQGSSWSSSAKTGRRARRRLTCWT